jgi:hypothetical protein
MTMVAVSTSTGQAIFSGLSINKAGTGYTLTATGSTVDTTAGVVVSSAFNITTGTATQLAFTTSPSSSTGGAAFGTQPVVTLEDAGGNTVTGTAQNVTLAIQNNAGPGGALSGTTMVAVSTGTGQAIFSGLSINKAGTGYTLTATGNTVSTTAGVVVSSAFNITTGTATQLAFTTEPSSSANGGSAFAQQPVVTVQDAGGNTVTSSGASITLAITSGTGTSGAALGCTANPKSASSGVDTFAGCEINLAGTGYTLTATSSGLSSAVGTAITINVGTAAQLAFTTSPSNSTGGAAFGTQPVVTLEDAGGNTVTGTAQNVTLAIQNNPGSGTLSGTTMVAVSTSTGQAIFSGLSINKSGTGYTLTATGNTVSTTAGVVVSSAFNITLGSAAQLAFTAQPGGGTGGTAWGAQPAVTVEDAGGNTVTSSSASITLAITSGTPTSGGPGTLTCTANPLGASSGIATFSGCSINTAGSNYKLTASSGTLTSATSSAFSITVGAAAKLAFTTQPGGGTGGTAWGTQPAVTVEDAGGNTVTTSSASITLAITSGTGTTGAALACTSNPQGASSGVATFAACAINLAGTGYTLTATSSPLTSATSSTFNITTGAVSASVSTVTANPTSVVANGSATSTITVTLTDAGGNPVSGKTVALGADSGSSAITGGGASGSNGVVTFTVTDTKAETVNYTATDTTDSTDITQTARVTFTASKLVFVQQPTAAAPGATITPAVTVQLQDGAGNNVSTSGVSITLSLTSGTGTLSGTTTQNTISGLATFDNLSINLGGSKTLTATSSGYTSAVSNAFTIGASKLGFVQGPSGAVAGVAISPAVTVQLEDANSTAVAISGVNITLSMTGTGTLSGTLTEATNSSGLATFSNLSVNLAGSKTLTASSTGLTSATSSAFSITYSTATQLVFTVQPPNSTRNQAFVPQPQVTVEDAYGNTVGNSTLSITLALESGNGSLSGCTNNPVQASGGVATFANCYIGSSGASDTLQATGGGFSVTSATFNVSSTTVSAVAFTTQPGGGESGAVWPVQPVAAVEDSSGRIVADDNSDTITLSIHSGSGTLTCTNTTVTVSAGVATFAGCSISASSPPASFTLQAAESTHTTDSSSFTIAGAANKLAFSTEPSTTTAGSAISPAVTVQVEDSSGNLVTNSTASVTIAISSGGAFSAGSTLTVSASGGVATFSNLVPTKAATSSFTLTASSSGLTSATSSSFTVNVGAATQVVFTTQPGGGAGGTAWSSQPVVTVEDASGNTVTSSSASITLAINNNPGGGALSCTTNPLGASSGVATFAGCKINFVGTGYTLSATSSGLASATSSAFNITAGTAAQLVFTTQPGGGTAGTAWSQQPVVTVEDAGGNTATSSASITLAIGTNPGSGTLTCTGGLSTSASSGVATFAGCSINKEGTGYTLTATSSGLTSATSNGFNVTAATATQLVFTTQPGGGSAGTAWTAQPAVTFEDASGNPVDSTANVTLAISNNPGSGTLTCTTNPLGATAGVATFAGCQINKTGTNYTLTASSPGLPNATSGSFSITPGTATQLVYLQQPTNTQAGSSISPAVTVQVEDANNNVVTTGTGSTASVAMAIGTNPGSGTLSGTTPVSAVAGVATFSNLSINKTGTGYTLAASSTGLTGATSNTFNITTGTAAKLAFGQQPTTTTAGSAISPPVTVQVEDSGGNLVTTDSSTVTITISTGGAFSGTSTTSVAASGGVATFSNLVPTNAGSFTLSAADGSLTGATSNSFSVDQAPAITSANNTTFVVGTAGSFTVTATGYPAPTFSETGTLPSGVTLSTAGVLGGTPAAGTGGSYPITITASNGVGSNATQSFTLTVDQAPAITSANNTTFKVGTAGSFTVTATGYPTSMTFSETGTLPSGVTLSTAGVLSGTPAASTGGSYPITITASNGVTPNGTQSFTLTVDQAPAITSANNTSFTVGTAGSFTVTATGYPAPTFTETGTLPSGVTLSTAGVLSGTPAASTGGSYPITITAANGVTPNATQNFTLTVDQAPAITSANNTTFTVGTTGSFTVTATGYPTSMTFSETGSLPSGVTLTSAGVLSGTPAASTGGSYPITITASNGVTPNGTQSFTLTVDQAPAITSANNTSFTVGTAGSFTVTATGYPTSMTFSETGTLPSGVTLSTAGVLSGTPAAGTGGSYPITITASNGISPNATQSFTLYVQDFTISASPTSQSGVGGTTFYYTVSLTNLGGFSGSVALSCGGVTGGSLSCSNVSFSPTSISGTGTSTMTVTTGLTIYETDTITITAKSGNLTRTFQVTVTFYG